MKANDAVKQFKTVPAPRQRRASGGSINIKPTRRVGLNVPAVNRVPIGGGKGVSTGRIGKRTMRKSVSTSALNTIGKKCEYKLFLFANADLIGYVSYVVCNIVI